jgi:hypothetical protein
LASQPEGTELDAASARTALASQMPGFANLLDERYRGISRQIGATVAKMLGRPNQEAREVLDSLDDLPPVDDAMDVASLFAAVAKKQEESDIAKWQPLFDGLTPILDKLLVTIPCLPHRPPTGASGQAAGPQM